MIKNGLYSVISGIIRALFTFISIPILVHQMGIEDYGAWSLVSSILGIVIFAEAGLPISAVVFISRDILNDNNRDLPKTLTIILSLIFVVASISSVLLYYCSSYLPKLFSSFDESQMGTVIMALKISSFSVWLQLVQQVFTGIEQGYQSYKIPNIFSSLQSAALTSGWVFLSFKGFGVIEFVWWLNLISLISFLFHALLVANLVDIGNFRFSWDLVKAKEIIHYSLLSWVIVIGRALFTRGDRLIVASTLGPEKLSLYSIFFDFSAAIPTFSSVLIQPLTPVISNEFGSSEPNVGNLAVTIRRAMHLNFLSIVFLGVLMLIISPFILRLSGVSTFLNENLMAFRLSVFINSIIGLNSIGYWILFATKNLEISAINQLVFGVLSLILVYFCSSKFGLIGAVTGNIGYIGTLSLSFIALNTLKMKVYRLVGYLTTASIVTSAVFIFLTVAKL